MYRGMNNNIDPQWDDDVEAYMENLQRHPPGRRLSNVQPQSGVAVSAPAPAPTNTPQILVKEEESPNQQPSQETTRDEIAALKRQLELTTQQCTQLANTNQRLQEQFEATKKQTTMLETKLESSQKRTDALQNDLQASNQALVHFQQELANSKNHCNVEIAEIKRKSTTRDNAWELQLKKVVRESHDWKAKYHQTLKDYQQIKGKLDSQAEVFQRTSEEQQYYLQIKERMTSMETHEQTLHEALRMAQEQIKRLQQEKKELQGKQQDDSSSPQDASSRQRQEPKLLLPTQYSNRGRGNTSSPPQYFPSSSSTTTTTGSSNTNKYASATSSRYPSSSTNTSTTTMNSSTSTGAAPSQYYSPLKTTATTTTAAPPKKNVTPPYTAAQREPQPKQPQPNLPYGYYNPYSYGPQGNDHSAPQQQPRGGGGYIAPRFSGGSYPNYHNGDTNYSRYPPPSGTNNHHHYNMQQPNHHHRQQQQQSNPQTISPPSAANQQQGPAAKPTSVTKKTSAATSSVPKKKLPSPTKNKKAAEPAKTNKRKYPWRKEEDEKDYSESEGGETDEEEEEDYWKPFKKTAKTAATKQPDKKQQTSPPKKKQTPPSKKQPSKSTSVTRIVAGKKIRVIEPPNDDFVKVWPKGWRKEEETRRDGDKVDRYWYTPIMGYRLRSMVEVKRFMAALEECNGDETRAKAYVRTGRMPLVSPKAGGSARRNSKGSDSSKKKKHAADAAPARPKKKKKVKKRISLSRRDRGRIHIAFCKRLEAIRQTVECRPGSYPFLFPVTGIPDYYDIIKSPIDLDTIRKKLNRLEYKAVNDFVDDFELMQNNAILYNGAAHFIAKEGQAIYRVVQEELAKQKYDLSEMEQQVQFILNDNAPTEIEIDAWITDDDDNEAEKLQDATRAASATRPAMLSETAVGNSATASTTATISTIVGGEVATITTPTADPIGMQDGGTNQDKREETAESKEPAVAIEGPATGNNAATDKGETTVETMATATSVIDAGTEEENTFNGKGAEQEKSGELAEMYIVKKEEMPVEANGSLEEKDVAMTTGRMEEATTNDHKNGGDTSAEASSGMAVEGNEERALEEVSPTASAMKQAEEKTTKDDNIGKEETATAASYNATVGDPAEGAVVKLPNDAIAKGGEKTEPTESNLPEQEVEPVVVEEEEGTKDDNAEDNEILAEETKDDNAQEMEQVEANLAAKDAEQANGDDAKAVAVAETPQSADTTSVDKGVGITGTILADDEFLSADEEETDTNETATKAVGKAPPSKEDEFYSAESDNDNGSAATAATKESKKVTSATAVTTIAAKEQEACEMNNTVVKGEEPRTDGKSEMDGSWDYFK